MSQRPFRACAKLSVFGKKARNRHFESAILFCFGNYVKLTPIHSRSPGPIPSFSPATRQPSSKKFLLYFYPLVVVLSSSFRCYFCFKIILFPLKRIKIQISLFQYYYYYPLSIHFNQEIIKTSHIDHVFLSMFC